MKKKKEKGQPCMGMAGIIIDGVATIIVVGLSWLTSLLVLVTIFKIISFKKKKKTKKKKQKRWPCIGMAIVSGADVANIGIVVAHVII